MNLVLKHSRRMLAAALALVFLVSGAVRGLGTPALAAGTSYNLYAFIAANCYSDQPVATKILTSGALVDAGGVTISYPGSDLLSVADGKLNAKCHALYGSDGRVHSVWEPVTYTIGDVEESFNGATSVTLTQQGSFHVDVTYRLDTGIGSDKLDLPAVLAEEAASQITVLRHLIAYDKPYMSYMEQMNYSQMGTLYDILDPNSGFAGFVTLNSDAQKNVALKNSFREVIANMRANCYLSDGTLTFFDLLVSYESKGLIHYYQNSASYQAEIDLFNRYLNDLLAAETRDGVYLTEADKEAAIEEMMGYAVRFEYIEAGVTLDFVDLRDNVNTANAMLSAPNAAINRSNSAKLKSLVKILEKEAVAEGTAAGEEGVVQWNSLISAYGGALTLTQTVSANLNSSGGSTGGSSGGSSGSSTGSGSGGSTGGSSGGSSGSSTGSGSGSSSGGSSGSSTGSGSGSSTGGSSGGSTSYAGTVSSLKNALTNADAGDTVRVTADITMKEDLPVESAIKITGAGKLDDTGHVLTLADIKASITADAPLNVASGVDGYVPVKSSGNTYTLAEVQHPETGGETAGSKTEKLEETRYLYLDLDPTRGMTLDALYAGTSFGQLTDYTVKFSIQGNSGTGLVKTADRLVVEAFNSDGKRVAQITYVVIVVGDTNCNGKVNTSDAVVTRDIGLGKEVSPEVRMAADSNLDGTAATPKISSSDVSSSMAKWFAWDRNEYVSKLK